MSVNLGNSMSEEKGEFLFERTPVKARVVMKLGTPSEITLTGIHVDREVRVIGEEPSVAKNAPLTEDGVKERLAKMGNTFLSLSTEDIDIELDEIELIANRAVFDNVPIKTYFPKSEELLFLHYIQFHLV